MEETKEKSSAEEIIILLENYCNEMCTFLKNIKEKYNSYLSSLKSNKNLELSPKEESNVEEKRKHIMELYHKMRTITREFRKNNDYIFDCSLEKINNPLNEEYEESSSVKSTSDRSFFEELEASYYPYDYQKNNLNNLSFSSGAEFEESEIKKNPNSGDSGFLSSNNTGNRTIFFCTNHPGRRAHYQCRGHCDQKFCLECYNNIGNNSVHRQPVKIDELVNTISAGSQKIKNFLDWVEKFFELNLRKCHILLNLNEIPEIPLLDNVNYLEYKEQENFLHKISEPFEGARIFGAQSKKPNEEILAIIKRLTNSERIILQSGTVDLNIFSKIKEHSKFSLTVVPHINLSKIDILKKELSPILKNKFNTEDIIAEDRAFIISNNNINSKIQKNIYNINKKDISKMIQMFEEINNLKINFLNKNCAIKENNLESEYDAPFFEKNSKTMVGREFYYPPIGWLGIGVQNKIDKNWPIAYITFSHKFSNEILIKILNITIVNKKLDCLVFHGSDKLKNEFDKRNWAKIGDGIYLFQDIAKAEKYTGSFDINNKKYKILLMVRVQQDKIKEPKHNKLGYWVVEKEFVKIQRVLFKENKALLKIKN